ncbi:MAG: hypothetical protein LKI39_14760 [Bacteroides sp.]|jgi:ribosomal protein S8|nr:hypothetical protein [Bacteroides sp.]
MKAKIKDEILLCISKDDYSYREKYDAKLIKDVASILNADGYISITGNKMCDVYLMTTKGDAFLSEGGYVKEKKRKIMKSLAKLWYMAIGYAVTELMHFLLG